MINSFFKDKYFSSDFLSGESKAFVNRLSAIFDNFNENFENLFGYRFCRCYYCIFDILLESFIKCKGSGDYMFLKQTVQNINDDYLQSADYKMKKNIKSGLICGNDCPCYEEKQAACPCTFWEIDKNKFCYLVDLLNNDELLSLFRLIKGVTHNQ